MAKPFVTYLRDHLAGAEFAINLMKDLSRQDSDPAVGSLMGVLLPEVEADGEALEALVAGLGSEPSTLKETLAGIAQKAGRTKLSPEHPLGLFESIEVLSLGVLGKLALWRTIETLQQAGVALPPIDVQKLAARAETQHSHLELLRRQLAIKAFAADEESTSE